MAVRGAFMAGVAKQLGHPSGIPGLTSAAVQALQPEATAVVVDVGFGGGVGLKLLLENVGPSGRVHGVEKSDTMHCIPVR